MTLGVAEASQFPPVVSGRRENGGGITNSEDFFDQGNIRNNGGGFDTTGDAATSRNGNGLASMRERGRAIGGEIEIISRTDLGVFVKFDLPLSPRAGSRWRKYLPV